MLEMDFSSVSRKFLGVLIHQEPLGLQVVSCVFMLIRIKP
jgi:hypothetical protein